MTETITQTGNDLPRFISNSNISAGSSSCAKNNDISGLSDFMMPAYLKKQRKL